MDFHKIHGLTTFITVKGKRGRHLLQIRLRGDGGDLTPFTMSTKGMSWRRAKKLLAKWELAARAFPVYVGPDGVMRRQAYDLPNVVHTKVSMEFVSSIPGFAYVAKELVP